MRDANRLAINQQLSIHDLEHARKAAVGRVEAGEVGHALQIGRLVDVHNLEGMAQRRFA